MEIRRHGLRPASLGTQRELQSFHYGPSGGPKAYVQASLHADELPGMLVAHHLRLALATLEAEGQLLGEVVVVPVANPIGLAQQVQRSAHGRFDLATGENFNRHYPELASLVAPAIRGHLTHDSARNTEIIREAMRNALAARTSANELDSLRTTLLALACDADVVLDLHCDTQAVVHLYTGSPLWPQVEPLARLLGAEATLLETASGDEPFDEAASRTWWLLREAFPDFPIALACVSATVELRGQDAVGHDLARADALRLLDFLRVRGIVAGGCAELPPLRRPATPLAGSEALVAPSAGVVVFLRDAGEMIDAGDAVLEVVDPLSGEASIVRATVGGVLYARETRHYAMPGMRLAKIAGDRPFRSGKLLSE